MQERRSRGLAIASAVLLTVDILIMAGFIVSSMLAGPMLAEVMENPTLQQLGVELPIEAGAIFPTHYILIPAALILIAKEWWKKKGATLIINIVAFIVVLVLFGLYLRSLYLPIINLMESMPTIQ